MPDTDVKPTVSPVERDQIQVSRITKLSEDKLDELQAWLCQTVSSAIARRERELQRIERWRLILEGINPEPRMRASASHVSVPMTMWARGAIHARIMQSLFGTRQFMRFEPVQPDDAAKTHLKHLANFFADMILNPRGLNGKDATERGSSETVDTGLGAILVRFEEDEIYNVAPLMPNDPPRRRIRWGNVRWDPIPFDDLLYPEGFGTDTSRMPWVGYTTEKTWAQIKQWGALGHYDPECINEVEGQYETSPDLHDEHPAHHMHQIAEIYTDFDINNDGILESVVIDLHVKTGRILRVAWNRFQEHRPMVLMPFDLPARPRKTRGQGVPEKLDGPQTETNSIHNIGIEAGKRAMAFVTLVRADRMISEELRDADEVLPGDLYTTEDPDTDLVTKPLGDPRSVEPMLALETVNQQYVARMLGTDESRLGDMESGKRVAASVGMNITREGRVPIVRAINAISSALTEAVYLTLDAWSVRPPIEHMKSMLPPDSLIYLENTIFTPNERSPRERLRVKISAADVATAAEERKSELMMLTQFLFTFYERITQTVMMISSPQVPPNAKPVLMQLLDRMQIGVRKLLHTLESIDDPTELLLEIEEVQTQLGVASRVASAAQPQRAPEPIDTPPSGGAPETLGEPVDQGAGVT